jgi:hypothetical protein
MSIWSRVFRNTTSVLEVLPIPVGEGLIPYS